VLTVALADTETLMFAWIFVIAVVCEVMQVNPAALTFPIVVAVSWTTVLIDDDSCVVA